MIKVSILIYLNTVITEYRIEFFLHCIAITPRGIIVIEDINEESSKGMWARSVKTLIERNIRH